MAERRARFSFTRLLILLLSVAIGPHKALRMFRDVVQSVSEIRVVQQFCNILTVVNHRLVSCINLDKRLIGYYTTDDADVLQDVQHVQDVYRVAQKILDRLEEPIPLEGHTLSTRTSMGIALCPLDGNAPDVLLQRADRAM